jgi:hypothetical protein
VQSSTNQQDESVSFDHSNKSLWHLIQRVHEKAQPYGQGKYRGSVMVSQKVVIPKEAGIQWSSICLNLKKAFGHG